MHVLQTYVSIDLSEENQNKGRTARQGKKGTYSWLLEAEELKEQLGLELSGTKSMCVVKLQWPPT